MATEQSTSDLPRWTARVPSSLVVSEQWFEALRGTATDEQDD